MDAGRAPSTCKQLLTLNKLRQHLVAEATQGVILTLLFSMLTALGSQRAPCMLRPTMYAPSLLWESTSSIVNFFSISLCVCSLSSSH